MGHPQLNDTDALLYELNEFINLLWRDRFLQQLSEKRVMKGRVAVYNIRERCSIQNEENRSRTDPCGTPQLMVTGAELQLFTVKV